MLNDATAAADDAPPRHDMNEQTAIRGVLVIRELLAQPRLTRAEISELRGRKFHHLRNAPMTTSDAEARRLVEKYGGLIWKIVSEAKFTVRRQSLIDRDDLFSIGCAMMLQSVEMYEEGRGAKLSTWIAFRVRQGLMNVVNELHGSLREDGGRTSRGEELARARGDSAPKVWVESLQEPVLRDDHAMNRETLLIDTIPSEDAPPDERLESSQEREWLTRTIDEICEPRERDVLYRMLAGEPGQDIAIKHGIARQRVDQIYQGAIAKLARRRRIEDVKRERALRSPSA